jgi:hypothetical protein
VDIWGEQVTLRTEDGDRRTVGLDALKAEVQGASVNASGEDR